MPKNMVVMHECAQKSFRFLVGFIYVWLVGVWAEPVKAQFAPVANTISPELRITPITLSDDSYRSVGAFAFLREGVYTPFIVRTNVWYSRGCARFVEQGDMTLSIYRLRAYDCSDACPVVRWREGGCSIVTSTLRDGKCLDNTTTFAVECRFSLPYYAEPTDLPGRQDDSWVAALDVSDGHYTVSDKKMFGIASLKAVHIEGAIEYGKGSLGALLKSPPITIHNSGNVTLSTLNISSKPLLCTRGSIPPLAQRFSFQDKVTNDQLIALSPNGTADVSMMLEKSNRSRTSSVSVFWWLSVPRVGVGGVCNGTTSYSAL